MAASTFVSAVLLVVAAQAAQADRAKWHQGGQPAAAKDSPLAGEWIANIPKSRLSPNLPLTSVTLRITVEGDTITMASRFADASGKEQQAAETFRGDGTETPGKLNPDIALMAKWLGPHVLATLARRGDEVIALVTYQVSSDGNTMTLRSSGMVEHVIVFDRK